MLSANPKDIHPITITINTLIILTVEWYNYSVPQTLYDIQNILLLKTQTSKMLVPVVSPQFVSLIVRICKAVVQRGPSECKGKVQ
jgi:hypothetical protein